MLKKLYQTFFGLLIFTTILNAGDPPYYQKKSTWFETVLHSREALTNYKRDILNRSSIILGVWYSFGPIWANKPFDVKFVPEQEINLNKTYGTIKWTAQPDWKEDAVHYFNPISSVATYILRTITVKSDTALTAYLGSDDGVKVWLNDSLLFAHDIDRGCAPNQEIVTLPLKSGENRFLMKITNGDGAHAFYFSLFDIIPRSIWTYVERDFTSPADKEEMLWELQDRIWSEDWEPGDYFAIAKRYGDSYLKLARQIGERPTYFGRPMKTLDELQQVRMLYVDLRQRENTIRTKEMAGNILTPKSSPKPRINGPKVYGVRPGSPFHYTIPATGKRPIEFSAKGLPKGLILNPNSGIITGVLEERGEHKVALQAKNSLGTIRRPFKIIVGDKIALTPPLGWNSWNCFAEDIDDQKIRAAADAFVSSGLINHGWTYVNIDDCWMVKPESCDSLLAGIPRDSNGNINTNKKFPDMKSLGDYIHNKGLKFGIYSSPGPLTCAGFTASYQYEEKDAQQLAEWGVDYLKYDWCSYGRIAKDKSLNELKKPYLVMRSALDKVKRDIVYSLCQYGMGNVWEWGADVGGNCWRTTGDIVDTWESMSGIGFNQAGHERYAGPGHWNDPDMLVVGYVGWGPQLHMTRLNSYEQYTHISLWTLLAAPLLIGCDLTKLDDFTLNLLTNDEVLDVHQDPLGKQASRISQLGELEVWSRLLEDGSLAVGLFNRGDFKTDVTVKWKDLGIKGKYLVRDLWRQKNLGSFSNSFTYPVERHGVVLVKVSKVK
jgi:alpha-galactosidase